MNVTRPALGILLASLLAACSAIRPPVAATPAPAATSKPSTEDSDESRLPRLELDERLSARLDRIFRELAERFEPFFAEIAARSQTLAGCQARQTELEAILRDFSPR